MRTLYKTAEFSCKYTVFGLSVKKKTRVAFHFESGTYWQIPKISNFRDNSLGNFRDYG